jgi:hypothetical protein
VSNVRAGDPFVCVWCAGGAHSHCLGPACECVHVQESLIPPERRRELRTGAEPRDARELEFQVVYRTHQEVRRAADQHRA